MATIKYLVDQYSSVPGDIKVRSRKGDYWFQPFFPFEHEGKLKWRGPSSVSMDDWNMDGIEDWSLHVEEKKKVKMAQYLIHYKGTKTAYSTTAWYEHELDCVREEDLDRDDFDAGTLIVTRLEEREFVQ